MGWFSSKEHGIKLCKLGNACHRAGITNPEAIGEMVALLKKRAKNHHPKCPAVMWHTNEAYIQGDVCDCGYKDSREILEKSCAV